MANVVITMALCLIAYIIGYKIGYKDCFEYLIRELKKKKEEKGL